MLVSERLSGLFNMMQGASYTWNSVSSLSRRLTALAVISEMRVAIDQLEELNKKLEIGLSVEDADIDFDQWFNNDESNDDNTYTRNKIRNIVIPYIKEEFNPNIIRTLNRLSEISAEVREIREEDEQVHGARTRLLRAQGRR